MRLEDRLRDLVGDVEFSNPWEKLAPLRLVHRLEHTSGFDELSVANVVVLGYLVYWGII